MSQNFVQAENVASSFWSGNLKPKMFFLIKYTTGKHMPNIFVLIIQPFVA